MLFEARQGPAQEDRGGGFRIYTWGFPKIGGTILGVPIIRTIVYWDLFWGPLILGNYHLHLKLKGLRGLGFRGLRV